MPRRKRDNRTIQFPTSRGSTVIVVDPEKDTKSQQEKQASKPKPRRKSPRQKLGRDVTDAVWDLRDRYLDVFNRIGIREADKYTPCRDADALPSKVGDMRFLTQNNPEFVKFLPAPERSDQGG